MRILVTGGTGLIGRHLVPRLLADGHQLALFVRKPSKAETIFSELRGSQLAVRDQLAGFDPSTIDAVINLAGEAIAAQRWSTARKQLLRSSRIELTQDLMQWLNGAQRERVILSGSAVGIYGNTTQITPETSPNSNKGFASQLCVDWESAAREHAKSARLIFLRTGLVLSPLGGLMGQLRLPFKLGLGGKLGRGEQFMPWIHWQDYINALIFLLNNPELSGPINLCAPHAASNTVFTQRLAKHLRRPAFCHAPAFALKLALGELSSLLLEGQNCVPHTLINAGFTFQYQTLDDALDDLS